MTDPDTLEQILKAATVVGATAVAGVVLVAGVIAASIKYSERRDLVDRCRTLYSKGVYKVKPNMFNIYKITDPKNYKQYVNPPKQENPPQSL